MNDVPELASAAWTDLRGAAVTVVVPLGSLEQHGPHLPLATDSQIATEVASRGVARTAGTTLGPTVPYGASGEHEGFPGTVSIGSEALGGVLLEIGRSACRWAARLLFVNGHGGNGPALQAAVTKLRYEGRDAAWFPCAFPGADAHAGFTETSVLLEISPVHVRTERAEAGDTRPIGELLEQLREVGVAGVSPNGVLGDPTGATADDGARALESASDRLVRALGTWDVDDTGRLR